MSGLKSIVFTTLLAAACGVGVVALVSRYVEPGGSLFGAGAPSALFTGGTDDAGASGGSASMSGGATTGDGCVVKRASLPLDDGVTLEAFIVLGPAAVPAAGGAAQRLLVADFEFRLHGFSLQSAQLWATVAADDRGRRATGTEFDVHLAGRSASTLLGARAEVAAPYAETQKSPFYSAQLDPRSGLTWGEIASDADLVLSVSQQP